MDELILSPAWQALLLATLISSAGVWLGDSSEKKWISTYFLILLTALILPLRFLKTEFFTTWIVMLVNFSVAVLLIGSTAKANVKKALILIMSLVQIIFFIQPILKYSNILVSQALILWLLLLNVMLSQLSGSQIFQREDRERLAIVVHTLIRLGAILLLHSLSVENLKLEVAHLLMWSGTAFVSIGILAQILFLQKAKWKFFHPSILTAFILIFALTNNKLVHELLFLLTIFNCLYSNLHIKAEQKWQRLILVLSQGGLGAAEGFVILTVLSLPATQTDSVLSYTWLSLFIFSAMIAWRKTIFATEAKPQDSKTGNDNKVHDLKNKYKVSIFIISQILLILVCAVLVMRGGIL